MPLRQTHHRPALARCLASRAPTTFAAAGADWLSQRGQGGARRAGDTSSGIQSATAA